MLQFGTSGTQTTQLFLCDPILMYLGAAMSQLFNNQENSFNYNKSGDITASENSHSELQLGTFESSNNAERTSTRH